MAADGVDVIEADEMEEDDGAFPMMLVDEEDGGRMGVGIAD